MMYNLAKKKKSDLMMRVGLEPTPGKLLELFVNRMS